MTHTIELSAPKPYYRGTLRLGDIESPMTPLRDDADEDIPAFASKVGAGEPEYCQPIGVVPSQLQAGKYQVVFGFRRVRAMLYLGRSQCEAYFIDMHKIANAPAGALKELKPSEQAAVAAVMAARYFPARGVQLRDGDAIIGRVTGLGGRSIVQCLRKAVVTLDRELLRKFDRGEVSSSTAYQLSTMAPEAQRKIATGEVSIPGFKYKWTPEQAARRRHRTAAAKNRPKVKEVRKTKSCTTLLEQIDELTNGLGELRKAVGITQGDLGTHIIDVPELDQKLKLAMTLLSQVRLFVKGQ